jgi:hypothetical protein
VWPLIPLALLGAAADEAACTEARALYEALSIEPALALAESRLSQGPDRPLACVEVAALALMVSGRLDEARARLTELFERDPDHVLEDPSLPPALRRSIEQIRDEVRPLQSHLTARWLIHESLRLDVALEGGLRDATLVRYRAVVGPAGAELVGELPLVGRAATGTIAVGAEVEARTLRVSGQIVGRSGRVLHQLSSEMLLPERPATRDQVVVESGVPWWIWVVVGAVTIGAAVTVAVVAQPDLPDAKGTFGRGEL